jgi:hypothetical protein
MYGSDEDLITNLGAFIHSGIRAKEPCIVVATAPHITALDEHLTKQGIDITEAKQAGFYVVADANDTLSQFMPTSLPDKDSFTRTIGDLLTQTARKGKVTRVYGEMVALLWADDNQAGAILLEQLWNDIAARHNFTLFCAYPMHYFENRGHDDLLGEIRRLHSAFVAPAATDIPNASALTGIAPASAQTG